MKPINILFLTMMFLASCSNQEPLDCNGKEVKKFIIDVLSDDLQQKSVYVKNLNMTRVMMLRFNEPEFSECSAVIEFTIANNEGSQSISSSAFDFEIRYMDPYTDSKEVDMFFRLRELSEDIETRYKQAFMSARESISNSIQQHMEESCRADPALCSQ